MFNQCLTLSRCDAAGSAAASSDDLCVEFALWRLFPSISLWTDGGVRSILEGMAYSELSEGMGMRWELE